MDENKNTIRQSKLKATVIFSSVLVVVFFFTFVYFRSSAYDDYTAGGFIPPSFGVIFVYIQLSILAIFSAVILKSILKHKITVSVLIIASIILPIVCYNVNYFCFQTGGSFYPLVSEGGPLQFLALHDFNFDGVDDSYEYDGNDVRSHTTTLRNYDPDCTDSFVSKVQYTIEGSGGNLDYTNFSYFWNHYEMKIFMHKSRVTYNYIKLTFILEDHIPAEKISFECFNKPLTATVESENTVSVRLDSSFCSEQQEKAVDERFLVPVKLILDK